MGFEWQPHIEGDLIRLRPVKPSDWDELHACAADPKIWEMHPQTDRYKPEVFRTFFKGALESGGAFVIIESTGGRIIGSSRFYDLKETSVTIGYTFLAREFWGGRYNLELKRLMLEHAYRYVPTVIFEIGSKNLRSRRAVEKLGARLKSEEILGERPHAVYELLKKEWRG